MRRFRIRTIKPELWQSLAFGSLSVEARLLYVGIVSHADDSGRMEADPRLLKALVFPFDEKMTSTSTRRALDELGATPLVSVYAVSGAAYVEVSGWIDDQRIDRPTPSQYPAMPVEESTSPRRVLDESSRWIGSDRIGSDPDPDPDSDPSQTQDPSAVAASEPAAPPASPRKRAPRAPKPPEERKRPEWVDEWSRWWSATWPEYHNGQLYRFESAHDGKALVVLGDRYRPEDIGALQAAVVWAWRGTDYHAGRASTHWRFLAAAGELLGLSTRSAPSRNGTGPSHEPTEDELVAAMVAEAHERAERKRTARGATP